MPEERVRKLWEGTLSELAKVRPEPALEPAPEQSGREYTTYRVIMSSFGGQRIRAWYSVPKDPPPGGRFPAVMTAPGYGGDKPIPVQLVQQGYVVLTLFPRSQGESRSEGELESGTKLTYNITDPQSYYYRGAYMDCVRGVDFLSQRQEVDSGRIGMWGRSQGGGLTLATASLDGRLRAAVAEEPFLCNYPVAAGITTDPYRELNVYLAEHPEEREVAMNTLSYYDPLNLADTITCPILMNIGLKDRVCPSATIMPVFDAIRSVKAVFVYPELEHSPCTDFNIQAYNWLKRYLG
ncbi:MAG: hypothetical protein HW403_509 [Dehalococcoidia bacterium]|nr:hypothetical protein [Dehalococcoidia bacterium]